MGAIKRTKHDVVFSNYIRERDNWTCQRPTCGKVYSKYITNHRRALHCSHFHGRGNWAVRFDPDNAVALCYGCHRIMGANPEEHREFIKSRLGAKKFNALRLRKNEVVKKRLLQSKEFLKELQLMLEDVSE